LRLARARCALACAALAACSPRAEPTKPPQQPPLHVGPLTDFVSAAGLRWLALARPRELAQNADFARAAAGLLPEARLAAYARTTGVELRSVTQGLIAGFDFATLYMAEMRTGHELVEERFEERLLQGAVVESRHPKLQKLTGVVGQTPETLVVSRGQWVAVTVGDPSPARVAESFALRRLKRSPPALRGSALSTLPAHLERAPLRFYAPGPFAGEWARAARGLVGQSLAVGIAATPRTAAALDACIVLSGDHAAPELDAEARMLGAWQDLSQSSTGVLLGLNEASGPAQVKVTPEHVELCVALSLPAIARGLRAAVSADAWELLDVRKPQNPDTSHLPVQKR